MSEREALLALTHVAQLGPVRLRTLLEYFGSAVEVLHASREALLQFPGIGPRVAEQVAHAWADSRWREDLRLVEAEGVDLISIHDARYPARLRQLHDAPVLLYVKGVLTESDQSSLAIVGTRQITRYGEAAAEEFGRDMARNRWTVISGLARGADTAAHRGALSEGRTIAVIGSGLAQLYPRENKALAETIAENGAVITEYPMRTPPDRQNFPKRNRIVSGMSRGALLIQAPSHSGAMLTMRLAHKQGRDCFAIPGPLTGGCFAGNHALIKEGIASLVESAEEIVNSYGDLFASHPKSELPTVDLDPEERSILQVLEREELSQEELLEKTKLPVIKLNVLLMSLLLKKVVREYPGKIYKKVS